MTDSQPAPDGGHPETQTVNLAKAIGQHLQALARSGVAFLPRGSGQIQYLIRDSHPGDRDETDPASPPEVAESGIDYPVEPQAAQVTTRTPTPSPAKSKPAASLLPTELYGTSLDAERRQEALDVIEKEVATCCRCEELCRFRTQTVFGVGNINPRLVFLGEGPGADEDRQGEPFVGAAGQKLNKIIAAIQMARQDVYILNTVKCRPPGNRNPTPTELTNCWEYLERQLEVLQPEFIVCLGSVAAKRLLNTTQSIGRLRQQFFQYRGSRVLVTYHPAYLLRTESANRLVWEDMKLLMKEMGIDY